MIYQKAICIATDMSRIPTKSSPILAINPQSAPSKMNEVTKMTRNRINAQNAPILKRISRPIAQSLGVSMPKSPYKMHPQNAKPMSVKTAGMSVMSGYCHKSVFIATKVIHFLLLDSLSTSKYAMKFV